jgi:phospholipid/cholesterol/gamma-HCH transport system permease protein
MNPPFFARINTEYRPDGILAITFSGEWTRHAPEFPSVEPILAELASGKIQTVVLTTQELREWDSRLPTFLIKIINHCQQQNIKVVDEELLEGVRGLLHLACTVPERIGMRRREQRVPVVAQIGQVVLNNLKDAQALLAFVGETTLAIGRLAMGKAQFRMVDLIIALQAAGPSALAIVTLISLLFGLILAFVGADQLAMFGAQVYIANLVGLGMVREMGALMTAVIMAGRTGAAYAAQLGTMNVNSEIDALKTMGISPIEFLVLPRLLALSLMMPLLGAYAIFVGILGGWLVASSVFDISLVQYVNGIIRAVDLYDFGIGLVKCLVFAVLVAIAGCMRGIQCGHSASAVGEATTSAVVDSIVYIVVADSIITLLCNRLGI